MTTNIESVTVLRTPSGVLLKALKAALVCASNDQTKPHLYGALLETGKTNGRLVSTNGHTLAKIDFDADTVLIGSSYLLERSSIEDALKVFKDTKKTAKFYAAIRQNGSDLTLEIYNKSMPLVVAKSFTFPPYASVIPELGTVGIGSIIGIGSSYLADVASVSLALGATAIKITPFTCDRSPMRFECQSPGVAEAVIVVMPIRI
jgi:DNA polymerase III sliding clamp (beta) subunit (PCNA family)